MSQCSTEKPPNSFGPLMTVSEVCAFARCGRTFLYGEVAAGRLPLFKLGAASRFRLQDVESWLMERLVPVESELA